MTMDAAAVASFFYSYAPLMGCAKHGVVCLAVGVGAVSVFFFLLNVVSLGGRRGRVWTGCWMESKSTHKFSVYHD